MRKIIALTVVVLLLFSIAACGGASEPVSEPVSEPEPDVSETELTLQELDGWWYMDPDYPEGLHLFELFRLDSANETFSPYDSHGNELYTGDATIDTSGILILSVDVFGDIELTHDAGALYDEDGVLAFTKGNELEAPDMSGLSGRWYLEGDTSGEYYELTDDSFRRVSEGGDEFETGSYKISATTEMFSVGEPFERTMITFGDETFAAEGAFSPGFELFVVSDFGERKTYIREDALDTAEGDTAIYHSVVLNSEWQSTDNSGNFSFYPNGAFEYKVPSETDDGWVSFEPAASGSWVLESDVLHIVWEGGTEDVCDFSGNSFYVPSLDATLFNGKADAAALDSWYGSYAGELGEIHISDSIIDNSISVSIYLDDDIGSMYSTSLKLKPDGGTASDEYIAIHLDGTTLTVEPLDASFDNYAGTFDKQ